MNATKTTKKPIFIQNDFGYRYSIEPFLLADFVQLLPSQKVLDIGTGCGIIPLLMVFLEPTLKVTGIEIQNAAADNAEQNVTNNKLDIKIFQDDFNIHFIISNILFCVISGSILNFYARYFECGFEKNHEKRNNAATGANV